MVDGKIGEVTERLRLSLKSGGRECGFYSQFVGMAIKGLIQEALLQFYFKGHTEGNNRIKEATERLLQ